MNAFPAISGSTSNSCPPYRAAAQRSDAENEVSTFTDRLDESSTSKTRTKEEPKSTDFSHMSSRELRTWINEQLQSGKMTFDESTSYVSLTLNGMPANGDLSSYLDKKQDYIAAVQAGIEGAKWRNDQDELAKLQAMLAKMREASAASAKENSQTGAQTKHTDSQNRAPLPDFSNITPRELQNWYHEQVNSGNPDEDVFLNYATLALGGEPVDGDQETFLNTAQNYAANLRDGIAGARWMHDEKKAVALERILEQLPVKNA